MDLVLGNGLSSLLDGSSSTPLKKGLGNLGLIVDAKEAKYFSYDAKNGEDITIDLQAKSACSFEAKLLDVHSSTLVANASFSAAATLKYTTTADVKLELELSATGSGPLECVFSVQLAGVYVPPTTTSTTSTVPPTSLSTSTTRNFSNSSSTTTGPPVTTTM